MFKRIEAFLTYSVIALLLIITGFAIGLLVAAIYFIPNYTNTLTFADIGGMLAGIGTIGLLAVAIRTANAWKKQSHHEQRINSLEDFYSKIDNFYSQSNKIIMLLVEQAMNEPSEEEAPTNIKDPIVYINEIDKLFNLRPSIESSVIRLNKIWSIKIGSNLLPTFLVMSRMRDSLSRGQSIFFTHNKAMTTHFDQHEIAQEEIDKLYKQLNN